MPPNPFQDGLAVEVGSDTSGLESGMDSAIAKVGELRGAVGLLGGALAAFSAGALAKATSSAAEFESQMADVEKVTDAETAKELEGRFMNLAETIPLPRKELVKLGEQAGKFGAEGPKEIMKFVETVGQIQTATDMAAEEAGTRFAKIAGAVGMPLSEVEKLGNGVNVLADSMKTDANEITDTANRTANILSQQLGIGEDAVLALSASMNEVSPSSRKAAGALTSMSEAMLDPKKVSDIASALGMTSDEFRTMRDEDPHGLMRKIGAAMNEGGDAATELRTAVGQRAARGFSKYGSQLERTEEAQKKVNQQFENGTSLSREMAIRTDTAAGKWQLFKNKIQNFATVTGQHLLPVAKELLGWANSFLDRLSVLNDKTNGLIGVFAGLAGVIGGLVTAFVAFLPQLAGIATILSGSVLPALGSFVAILTGPVGLAIAGVVAAVAGLALAWRTNFMGIRDVTADVIGGLQEQLAAAGEAFGALVDTVRTAGELIVASLTGTWGLAETVTLMKLKQDVRAAVEEGLAAIVETFDTLQQRIPPALASALNSAVNWLTSTGIPMAKQAFLRLVDGAVAIMMRLQEELPPLVDSAIRSAIDWVRNNGPGLVKQAFQLVVNAAIDTFRFLVDDLLPLMQEGITTMLAWVRANGPGLVKQAFKMLGQAMRFSLENFLAMGGILWGLFVDFIGFVVTYLKNDAVGDLKAAGKLALEGLKLGFETVIEAITPPDGIIAKMLTAIVDYLKNDAASDLKAAAEFLFDVIMAAAEGLWEGLIGKSLFPEMIADIVSYLKNDALSDLKAAAEEMWGAILKAAEEFAKELFENGGSIIKSLFEGIASYLSGEAASKVSKGFGDIIQGLIDIANNFAGWLINDSGSFFKDLIGDVASWLKSKGKSAVDDAFGTIVSAIEDTLNGIDLSGISDAIQGVIDKASSAIDKVKSIPSKVTTTVERTINTRHTSSGGPSGPSGGMVAAAHGGIVTGPTPLIAGEAGDDEAVIPLNRQGEEFFANAVAEALGGQAPQPQGQSGGGDHIMNVHIDGARDPQAIRSEIESFWKQKERRLR